jgi:hypothetical protein
MSGKRLLSQQLYGFLARRLIVIPTVLLFAAQVIAQAPAVQSQYKQERFTRQEVMIPMRDGVRLQTAIFTPKQKSGPLPILLLRIPYGVPEDEKVFASGAYDELIADGYIFVFQNIRGRFKSDGAFVMLRPPRDKRDPKSVDECTDAYRIERLHPVVCQDQNGREATPRWYWYRSGLILRQHRVPGAIEARNGEWVPRVPAHQDRAHCL